MEQPRSSTAVWIERIVIVLLFVALGALTSIVFSPWSPGPLLAKPGDAAARTADFLAKIGTGAALLALALLARRSPRCERYAPLLFGFFILTVAVSLDWIFAQHHVLYLRAQSDTPHQIALLKLVESFVVVSTIIALTLATGEKLDSIYLQRGKLKQGLIIGGVAFALAALAAIPLARFTFQAPNLTLAQALPWTPWVLIFVLANAALEELMYRGLFLRKLEPFLGKLASNLLIAVVFTALHYAANYTSDVLGFLAATFPLALVWGYLMQKTDAVWASILFHAGMDLGIILGLFANL